MAATHKLTPDVSNEANPVVILSSGGQLAVDLLNAAGLPVVSLDSAVIATEVVVADTSLLVTIGAHTYKLLALQVS